MLLTLMSLRAMGASNAPIARVVRGNDAMAFRLYAQLAQSDGNLVFSPCGISMALSMIAAGADGNTLEEMRHTLAIQQADAEHHAAFSSLMIEGPPHVPPVFLADHPFLFFILEQSSGTILFMGRVAGP